MENSEIVVETTRTEATPKAARVAAQERSVLITGASDGIGRALALALSARGYRVFAGVRRESDAAALRDSGNQNLHPVMLDVTDVDAIHLARETIESALGGAPLDALINNAGIAVGGPLECTPLAAIRHQFEVNVFGQLAVFQGFAPLLRAARGRIVNMGSMVGFFSAAFQGPYCASKYALEAFTDSMRRELEPFGVHVALIEPGSVESRIVPKATERARSMLSGLTDQQRELYGAAMERSLCAAGMAAANAVSTDLVLRVVTHALEAKRPRTRYLVGVDAHIIRFLARTLSDRSFDWLLRKLDQALESRMGRDATPGWAARRWGRP